MKKRLIALSLAIALVCALLPNMLLQSSAGGGWMKFLDEHGMPVEISARNETIFECTHGYAVDENGHYDENGAFYAYNIYEIIGYIDCEFADGFEGAVPMSLLWMGAFEDIRLEYSPASNEWKPGENVVTVSLCTYDGQKVSCDVVITILEMNIASIECEDIRFIEHSNGYWKAEELDEETWEYINLETPYYYYYTELHNLTLTLHYKDGTSETGSFYNLGLLSQECEIVNNQSSVNPWTVGNTYQVNATYCGLPFSFNVTIDASPLERIEVSKPIELICNFGGYWEESYWDEESQNYIDEPYYNYSACLMTQVENALTLYLRDGRIKQYSYSDDELDAYEREYGVYLSVDSYQGGPLKIGDTLTATVSYLGQECTVSAKLVESPVASVSLPKDLHILEGTCGYWAVGEDPYTPFFKYDLIDANASGHVAFRDGTQKDVPFSDEGFIFTPQGEPVPYGDGQKMTVRANYLGVETDLTVYIDPSPIVSLEIEPVIRWKDIDLFEEFDIVTWGRFDAYDIYAYSLFKLTATLRNGKKLQGDIYDIITEIAGETDSYYNYYTCWSDQSSANLWGLGNHTAQLGLFGHVYPYEVSVIDCPVASISAKDLTIEENTHIDYPWYYDETTGKDIIDKTKPYYDWTKLAEITVKMKDGSSISGSIEEVEDSLCHFISIKSDECYFDETGKLIYHHWEIGEHTAAVTLGANDHFEGFTAEFKVTITPAGNPPVEPTKFNDVKENAWYYDAVNYAVTHKLMNGVGNGNFAPDDSMTRAMLVTVLWRYEGEPKEGKNTFTDVPSGQWYTDAVAWAAANGIVGGVGNGKFDPNGNITREQMAAILYRYADGKKLDVSTRADLSSFPDGAKVSSWAKDAIAWAVAEKIIGGSDGKLLPQGNATRAQVSTILMRFIENFAK